MTSKSELNSGVLFERVLRRRTAQHQKTDSDDDDDISQEVGPRGLENEDTDSACEDLDEEFNDEDIQPIIPQKVITMADEFLSGLPPRWRNWLIRIISGTCLISGFSFLVWLGPAGLFFLTFLVVYTSLSEVLRLSNRVCNVYDRTTIRICWFIIGLLEYYLVAPSCINTVLDMLPASDAPKMVDFVRSLVGLLLRHHEAISFFAYLATIVYFVLTMQRSNYLKRYAMFAWTHMGMMFLCIPGHLMNTATLSGMIWYVVPMSVITINDIAAYMVGFFFGKTPLIRLSPKKTVEGFIGGGFLTVVIGTIFSVWISLKPSMVCPVDVSSGSFMAITDCNPEPLFQRQEFQIFGLFSLPYNGFLLHGFIISIFSSLIGPCGGFFASGFKRACKRKNFGSVIPGHGGVLDRCDCMFLMAIFIYVYHNILKNEGIIQI